MRDLKKNDSFWDIKKQLQENKVILSFEHLYQKKKKKFVIFIDILIILKKMKMKLKQIMK